MKTRNKKQETRKLNYALTAGIILFAAFSSCKKEQMHESNLSSISASVPNDDESIIREVTAFNEFYKTNKANALQKSTSNQPVTDFQIDKAVWLMEAQLNLMRRDTSGFENVVIDSAKVEVPLKKVGNDYKIEGGNLISTLNNLDIEVINHRNKVTQPDKRIAVVDLEYTYVPVGPNGEEPKAFIKMLTTIGINTTAAITPPKCDFGATDWWSFYTNQGRCNSYTGGTGSSADYEIEKKLNHPCYRDICVGHAVLTSVQTKAFNPSSSHSTIPLTTLCGGKGVYDYLFWTNDSYPDFHDCLCPEEMNYYRNSYAQIANIGKPVGTNYITSYDVNSFFTVCSTCPNEYAHLMGVTYAKRTCSSKEINL